MIELNFAQRGEHDSKTKAAFIAIRLHVSDIINFMQPEKI